MAILALRHPTNKGATAGSATGRQTPSHSVSTTPSKASSSSKPASHTSSAHATGKLPLIVLNNSTISGLAATGAADFTAGGWTVTSHGNYQNDIISTCAYYDPSVSGAQAAAEALQRQFPKIRRVKPRFTGLPSGPIVVVLTSDYANG